MKEGRSAFKILTGTPAGKMGGQLKEDIKEIGINTRNWFDSAEDRDYWRAHVNAAIYKPLS